VTAAATICVAMAACCMVVDWWAVATDRRAVEAGAKPAVMIALIGVVLLADLDPGSLRPWLLAGLAFGLIGDVALLPRFDKFLLGLAAFLVGHLSYVVAFAQIWSPSPWLAVGVTGAIGLVIGVGLPIDRALRGRSLRLPVLAYIAVTIAVLISGSGTGRALIAVGTLAFAASDGLLGAGRFLASAPERRVWIHVLYQLGQTAIVLGAISG